MKPRRLQSETIFSIVAGSLIGRMLFGRSERVAGRALGTPTYTHRQAMPTYEYRCTKGHTFEAFQSITDDPLTKCEVCGRKVVRVLHSPAVHFKGSGFYNTDYGTKKRQREKAASSSDSSSSSSSSSDSTGSASGDKPSTGGDSKASDSKGSSDSSSSSKAKS
jgi:putative FmdB family regulatory protein